MFASLVVRIGDSSSIIMELDHGSYLKNKGEGRQHAFGII
jgi:hypothetical protein